MYKSVDFVKCMKSCICYHQKLDIKHSHHLKIYFVAQSGWFKLVVALSHTPKVAGSISGKGACKRQQIDISLLYRFLSTRPPPLRSILKTYTWVRIFKKIFPLFSFINLLPPTFHWQPLICFGH